MQPGDTILYTNMDGDGIIGIVTSGPEWKEDLKGPAVRVCWMDDASMTYESVNTIADDDCDDMILI